MARRKNNPIISDRIRANIKRRRAANPALVKKIQKMEKDRMQIFIEHEKINKEKLLKARKMAVEIRKLKHDLHNPK